MPGCTSSIPVNPALLFTSKKYGCSVSLFFANSFNIFSNNIFEDTILSYPFLSNQYGGLFMNLPDNFTKEVVYDEDTDDIT